MLVVRVVQVLMGAVVEETVELRRLHSLRNLSSGAAAPIIRCMRRDVIWINTCHQHLVRTTTTTTTTTTTQAQTGCANFVFLCVAQ